MTGPLRPLDPATFPPDMREHVHWHLLFQRADGLTVRTGLGLAPVWHLIKQGRYDDAVEALDQIETYANPRSTAS